MSEPIVKKNAVGNKIYYKDANGYEQFWTYDEKNRLTRWHDSNGLEEIWLFDEMSRPVYMKARNGLEIRQTYEEDGSIFTQYSDGTEKRIDNKYRLVYQKNANGKIWKRQYE